MKRTLVSLAGFKINFKLNIDSNSILDCIILFSIIIEKYYNVHKYL